MLENFEKPGHGYYFMIGTFDALYGHEPRPIPVADAKYQQDYNDGYASGSYMEVQLDRTTM
jgi:hypothetical protein